MRGVRSKLGIALLSAVLLTLATSAYLLAQYPVLQRVKYHVAPFLGIMHRYDVPNTALAASLPAFNPPVIVNRRVSLEDRIAELVIVRAPDMLHLAAGGVLLAHDETRHANLLGQYSSYDPARTRVWVERMLRLGAERQKSTLIYDEGEGGYVMRVGTLPSAEDLGLYCFEDRIGRTMPAWVTRSNNSEQRWQTVRRIIREYAGELRRQGVNVVLAPVLDVPVTQSNMIGKDGRGYARYPEQVLQLARTYARILRAQAIKVMAKHYLTLGSVESGDVHEHFLAGAGNLELQRQAKALYKELAPDLDGILVGHAESSYGDGLPYSLSPRTAGEIREEVGFDGLLIADELRMKSMREFIERSPLLASRQTLLGSTRNATAKAALLAFDAGMDMVMLSTSGDQLALVIADLVAAYRSNSEFRSKIDRSLDRYAAFVRGAGMASFRRRSE